MSQFNRLMADTVPALREGHFDKEGAAYTTPERQTFAWDCSLSKIRGDWEQDQAGNSLKVFRTTAVGLTSGLTDFGVAELQRKAIVSALGYPDWSIDLVQSEWGENIVKLELKRSPFASLNTAEKHAAF